MKRITIAAATAAALIICCCSHAHPATGENVDACALMPKDLAEQVLAVKLGDPKSQRFGQNPRQTVISNCLYVASGGQEIGSVNLAIRIGSVTERTVGPADNFILTMKQTFGRRYELKKLTGLGDGAVWDDSLKQLTLFRGTSTYVWTSPGATAKDIEDKLVTLARKTVATS